MHLRFNRHLSTRRRTPHEQRSGHSRLCLALAAMFSIVSFTARADEPLFGFVYTTDLLPQGGKEIEEWASWRHQKNSGYFDELEGRTEFEYGLTDRLQVALYANYNWTQAYHNGPFGATTPPEQFSDYVVGPDDHFNASRFVGVSGELIYRILSPYTDAFGLALYTEPTVGQNFRETRKQDHSAEELPRRLIGPRVQLHLRAGISLPFGPDGDRQQLARGNRYQFRFRSVIPLYRELVGGIRIRERARIQQLHIQSRNKQWLLSWSNPSLRRREILRHHDGALANALGEPAHGYGAGRLGGRLHRR